MSKKKIRLFVKEYLPIKYIGGHIFVERASLEGLLADKDRERYPLKG